MTKTLIRIVCLILMLVSFIAYLARASAFPISSENLLPWSAWFFIFALANVIMWQRVMKLLSFVLLVIWFYAFAANIIPETSTASVDASSIERTPDAFVEAGEAIFNGKGKCHTCHNLGAGATKGRCPNMEGVGARAATRKPGMSAKEYFIESLYDPTAFLVTGYGKIMPPVWKPPISLSNLEIEVVIAFLQSQGGEVDVTPFNPPVVIGTAAEAEALPPILAGNPERGKNIFVNTAKCVACHDVTGVEKPVAQTLDEGVVVVTAPDLTEIAALNSPRYIEESVLIPDAEIVSGYGSGSVHTGGALVEGTLVSQEKGYFWIQITPSDATAAISGDLVEEDDESITLKVGTETQKISKSNVKVQVSVITFDDDEPIVGELVSESEDEIIVNVDGSERTIDQFDIDTTTTSRAFGKRISVKSPMPSNFPQLLSVSDFNDLLAFLSTLKGAEATETASATGGDAPAEEAEAEPAE